VNVSGLLALYELLEPYRALRAELQSDGTPPALGLLRAVRPALLAALSRDLERPMLVVVGSVERAKTLAQSLRDWSPAPERVLRFPEPMTLFYERAPWTDEVISGRLQALSAFQPSAPSSEPPLIVVASVRALMQRTLPLRQRLPRPLRPSLPPIS